MKVLKMAILNKGETRSASRRRGAIFRKFSRRQSSLVMTNNYSLRGFADGNFTKRLSLELDDSDVDDEETGGECRLLPATSTGYSIIPSEFRDMDPSLFE